MKALAFYKDLHAEYVSVVNTTTLDIMKVTALGKKLKDEGFQAESDVCFKLCVKVLENFAQAGQVDNCLAMESLIYASFVKTTENEDHYFKCFNLWSHQFQQLGRKYQKSFTTERDPYKICFVLMNGVLLGHTEVMLKTIDSWIENGIGAKLYVASLGGFDPKFVEMLQARSIKILQPAIEGAQKHPMSQAFIRLRDQLEQLEVQTTVWLSVPTAASFAIPLKLSPRQVFWSLKFHPVFVPEANAHICGGHESESVRTYNGHQWTVSPFPLTIALKDNKPENVIGFRKKFPDGAILLGSLAREEKFTSAPFLSAVCTILAQNPHAHFLWTGREQPASVLSAFNSSGVSSRCHFIGWVDTNLVAEALDVFLETFPFGCGVTGFQAMGHGTPLLSMLGPDTLSGLVAPNLLSRGHLPARGELDSLGILSAVDLNHYIELAQKLIDDAPFRKETGRRERAYFEQELAALPRYAARLWTNISGLEA